MAVVTSNQPLSVGNLEAVIARLGLYVPVSISGNAGYSNYMVSGLEAKTVEVEFTPAVVIPEDGEYQVYGEGTIGVGKGSFKSYSLAIKAGDEGMNVSNKSAQKTCQLAAGTAVKMVVSYYAEPAGYHGIYASASVQVTRVG